jgi:hypothetical protein
VCVCVCVRVWAPMESALPSEETAECRLVALQEEHAAGEPIEALQYRELWDEAQRNAGELKEMQAEHFAMATSFKAAEAALRAELASTNAKLAALEQATGRSTVPPPPRSLSRGETRALNSKSRASRRFPLVKSGNRHKRRALCPTVLGVTQGIRPYALCQGHTRRPRPRRPQPAEVSPRQ